MLVRDLILSTLKLVNVVRGAGLPTNQEYGDSLLRLQDMMDSFKIERLLIYNVPKSEFPLVAGKATYTIGLGGDINVPRPNWVQNAGIISMTNPLQPLELRMTILNDDEYAHLAIKNVPSSLSWYFYFDYAFASPLGLGNITIWPVPLVSTPRIALYLPTPISNFATLDDQVFFPPGYQEMLRYNLALRLAPEFGRPIDPVVGQMAVDTMANVQRANKRLLLLTCDPALVGGNGRRIFNWLSGESGPVAGSY